MAPSPRAVDLWNLCSLASPLAGLGANAVTQVLMVRARKGRQFLRCVLEGFSSGLLVLGIIEALLLCSPAAPPDALILSLLVNAPAYAALSYCYFGLVNLGQTSIRIRLYAEIAETEGGMTMEQIGQLYNEDAFMSVRLKRLVEGGDLVERDGRYFVARNRLVNAAGIIFAAKWIILGQKSEFADT